MRTVLLALSPFVLAACAARPSAPTIAAPAPPSATAAAKAPSRWSEAARRDVLAAFEQFRVNHPGSVDPENPGFGAQLTRARDEGLRIAQAASDREGYADALGAFSAVLSDGHAKAVAKETGGDQARPEWPGFVAAFRGDKIFVHHAGTSAPAVEGTEIVACDGLPAREFVRRRLLYRSFRPEQAGRWWAQTPNAFLSGPSFAAGRARRCTFGTEDKSLTWSPVPDSVGALVARATDGERTSIELSQPRDKIFLIGLPNFQPNDGDVKAYEALYAAVEKQSTELARARALVVDLRHNQGGSSGWSRRLAEALWGKAAVDQRMSQYSAGEHSSFRASEANLAHMVKLVGIIERQGNASMTEYVQRTAAGLRQALAEHAPFYVHADPEAKYQGPPAPTRLRTPTYVITPGGCASACLDAIDVFTRFENVKLIGAPTSADSTYGEVRLEELPSGEGQLVVPTKVYSHRPRASGQVYRPAIEVTDLEWSTKTFLDSIERDLEASRGTRSHAKP